MDSAGLDRFSSTCKAAEVQKLLAMLWPQVLDFPSFCYSSSRVEVPVAVGITLCFDFVNASTAGWMLWDTEKVIFLSPPLQSVSSGCMTWEHCWKPRSVFLFLLHITVPHESLSHVLCCHCVFYLANLQFCWDIYGLVAWEYSIRERHLIENVE